MSTPKPFVGYLMAAADFTPPPRTKTSWIYHLPPLHYAIGDAQAEHGGQDIARPAVPSVPYKVTVTFERVEQ